MTDGNNKEVDEVRSKAYYYKHKIALSITSAKKGEKFPRGWEEEYKNPSAINLDKKFPITGKNKKNIIAFVGPEHNLNGVDFDLVKDKNSEYYGKFTPKLLEVMQALKNCSDPWIVKTPSGGNQFRYRPNKEKPLPRRLRKKADPEYVDLLGTNGVVPCPPSYFKDSETGKEGYYISENSPEGMGICPTEKIYEFLPYLKEKNETSSNFKEETKWNDFFDSKNKEGERNDPTVRMIGKLICHISEEDWETVAWPLTQAYDSTFNDPPLIKQYGIEDLRTKFEGIKKAELAERSVENTLDNEKNKTSAPVSPIQFLTAKELIEHIPPKELWAIKHYFPLYASTILSAEPKTGKSMLAMYMAHCLSSGKDFLNKYPVLQGNVFYLDKELGTNEFQRRAIKFGVTKDSALFTSHGKSFLLDKKTFLPLREVLKDLDIKYLFLDSLRRIHMGKENDSDVIMQLFHLMDQYIEDGISIFSPHHNNKRKPKEGQFQPDFTEDEQSRGSSDIEGACGQLMHLTPKKDNPDILRIRWKRPRYEKHPPDEYIQLKEENDLLFFEAIDISGQIVKNKKDRFRVDLLKLIPKDGEITRHDLLGFCTKQYGMSEDTFDRRIKELLDQEVIDKVGDEDDGRGVRYMLLEK